ncbi:MAG TPA: YceH family protein [Acidimicrobiales bacterium]|nr:YceH family protein [Acidimicrobiales bacterium]
MGAEELSFVEARVLGCLMEKAATTPDQYPLTLNSVRLACNQTSSRNPVVELDEARIGDALTSLRARQLTRIVYSPSNRAPKHRHVIDEALGLDEQETALLCVLLLRGPQTVGELRSRTERMTRFADLGAVEETLDRLGSRETPLVVAQPRQPGQKEIRYVQLLSPEATQAAGEPVTSPPPAGPGTVPTSALPAAPGADPSDLADRVERVERLEQMVAGLRAELDDLKAELGVAGGEEGAGSG